MLKGSEKQVSWARGIRTNRLRHWQESDPTVFKDVEPTLKDETSAAWWITHREKELREVLPFIVAGGEKIVKVAVKAVSPVASNESYSGLDDVRRFVGELRDVATGEPVIDPDCPF